MNIIPLESHIYSGEQMKYFTFFELKKLKISEIFQLPISTPFKNGK